MTLETVKPDPAQVNQVVKWILTGTTSFDIFEAIATTYPDTPAGPLMLEAMRYFENAAKFEPGIVRGWCFEAARDLYRQMVSTGDFAGALRAVKQILEMAKDVQHRDAAAESEEGTETESLEASDAAEGLDGLREAQGTNGKASARTIPRRKRYPAVSGRRRSPANRVVQT